MPEMDGLELQDEIVRRGMNLPVIITTGHGDISLTVRAMKAGATDFIEKPFEDDVMLDCVRKALLKGQTIRVETIEAKAADDLVARLTPRESSVLDQLVRGRSNKSVGFELGISARTVETHRARIMIKMQARSLPDLVRIAIAARHAPARMSA
jgi:two-component system response regulator FixJ